MAVKSIVGYHTPEVQHKDKMAERGGEIQAWLLINCNTLGSLGIYV